MDNKPKGSVTIIGVPLSFGASLAGVDLGPAAMRVARLEQKLTQLGFLVKDLGDLQIARPKSNQPPNEKSRFLEEVSIACEDLSLLVERTLEAGEIPLVLGGDHSIAIGTISGISSYFRHQNKAMGLLWFDAHADMNTPETTESGNIHGMPLAALFGYGTRELTHIGGFAPKIDPKFCAHIGAREVDPGERELIKRLGIRFFTMREIDERGMKVCMDEAIRIASQAPAGFHVTLDIDALDPGDAPGSGTVVRGGLTFREAHLAMEMIADTNQLASLEVVEINTALDYNNKTAELGVGLILSALGKTIL
jgi:arginase